MRYASLMPGDRLVSPPLIVRYLLDNCYPAQLALAPPKQQEQRELRCITEPQESFSRRNIPPHLPIRPSQYFDPTYEGRLKQHQFAISLDIKLRATHPLK